ncbi:hypothetical protein NQD34_011683 [Periophthalmus magnuspinnatus]|nr:hypothetical protein NQD34_011683 [Periophthalmus magnuspinnatus]
MFAPCCSRAPEVFVGAPYNESIDVWSLGCVAIEMMRGQSLFQGWSCSFTVSLCPGCGSNVL